MYSVVDPLGIKATSLSQSPEANWGRFYRVQVWCEVRRLSCLMHVCVWLGVMIHFIRSSFKLTLNHLPEGAMDAMKSLQLLGNPTTLQDARVSYRKMALAHHPDKGGCKKKFQEINNAYDDVKKMFDSSLCDAFDLGFGTQNASGRTQEPRSSTASADEWEFVDSEVGAECGDKRDQPSASSFDNRPTKRRCIDESFADSFYRSADVIFDVDE